MIGTRASSMYISLVVYGLVWMTAGLSLYRGNFDQLARLGRLRIFVQSLALQTFAHCGYGKHTRFSLHVLALQSFIALPLPKDVEIISRH